MNLEEDLEFQVRTYLTNTSDFELIPFSTRLLKYELINGFVLNH
jgi:hypothetical protein